MYFFVLFFIGNSIFYYIFFIFYMEKVKFVLKVRLDLDIKIKDERKNMEFISKWSLNFCKFAKIIYDIFTCYWAK